MNSIYHILYDLETRYESLEMLESALRNLTLMPRVPITCMDMEDDNTPRVCVCETVEQCITAIGTTSVFRRCCNTNPDAKSYENSGEVYPIVVLRISDEAEYIIPTKQQVPDIEDTHERWIMAPIKPIDIQIKWLDEHSIKFREGRVTDACTQVKFVKNLKGKNHPWLNGKGHPLDCSDDGNTAWPDSQPVFHPTAKQFLCWDGGPMKNHVFPVPISNAYAICHVVEILGKGFKLTGQTYRQSMHRLCRFTGYHDAHGGMIFNGDPLWLGVETPKDFGEAVFHKGQWAVKILHTGAVIPMEVLAPDEDNKIRTLELADSTHAE